MIRNQRRAPRVRRRMKVDFGREDLSQPGFTQDFSSGGLLLMTQHIEPVGTRLHLHVHLPLTHFFAEGLVVRHKSIPRELRTIERPAMGIRFLTPQELIDLAMAGGARVDDALVVECADAPQVRALQEAIETGYVLAPSTGTAPAVNADVEVEVRMGFKPETSIKGRGRVVQILDTQGSSSVVVQLHDKTAVSSAVRALLSA